MAAVLAVLAVTAYVLWRAAQPSFAVRVVSASRTNINSIVSTNGIVQPTEEFQAHAAGPGVVKKLFVHVGDHVVPGQPLVQMDVTEAASKVAAARALLSSNEQALRNMQMGGTQDELLAQKADLAAAQMAVTQDQQALETRRKLLASGAASPSEVQQAQDRLAHDQARLAQLQSRQTGRYSSGDVAAQRAQVSQAEATLNAAASTYAGADIRAPFAGTVFGVAVNAYDFVEGGAPLLSVADLTRLQVRAYFDEPEVGKIAVGQAVTIEWSARPGRFWHGHVLKAPTSITTYGTRNVGESLITVDDAQGDLLPNTNVTIHVTTLERDNVLALPREALHTQGNINYVYRVVDGRLTRTPVTVGVVNVVQFEIVSGLKEGDTVVLHANTENELSDGVRVSVQR